MGRMNEVNLMFCFSMKHSDLLFHCMVIVEEIRVALHK